MKQAIKTTLLLLLLIITPLSYASAEETFPEPTGYVVDEAELLSDSVQSQMETDLATYEKETSIEISVVTVKTIGETYIEDYAVRLFEQWEIGKEGKDNGVLLLVALQERELRIEVGYGLEADLPDIATAKIINEEIVPNFQNNNYETGIINGVARIKSFASGSETVSVDESNEGTEGLSNKIIENIIFTLIMIFTYISSFLSRSKSFWMGGIIGGIGGLIIASFIGFSVVSAIVIFIFVLLGLLLDFVMSRNYKSLSKAGRSTNWWSSGGGFRSGGFGSSGGRGFGGFGGGRSGGGGASGKW